ncbi:hypothetical protein FTW19_02895 [Terriglobus albidus]|uniref:Two-component sensor histidine kinase n=1 Tax=Terriglobus albidus TaxID=1592106 RepID=A0A5B9E4Y7_9BACT|nr:hypothetical protein [Terriglobus albidus]QEE27048.1 hypothetical protein FTW19_02895 [Terriglobus albidus]
MKLDRLLRIYALSLYLYPKAFRERYREQLLDAARQAYDERQSGHGRLLLVHLRDSLGSGLWERITTPLRPLYAILLSGAVTLVLLVMAVTAQQIVRRQADVRPRQAVASIAARLGQGANEHILQPREEISDVDWLRSDHTFAAIYNPAGEPIAASATLHGAFPHLPSVIFPRIRQTGRTVITWQPENRLRLALTVRPLPDGNYVVAGQSLLPFERRESALRLSFAIAWGLILCAAGGLFLRRPAPYAPLR